MQREIAEINRLQKEWQSLPAISQDNQKKLDKKFRLEFNYNSNHIEGNTLTYGETELLLIFDKTEGTHEMREYEEMKAHDVAYNIIQEWAADKEHPLTETYIKQLNEIILVKPFWKEAQTQDGQATRRLIKVGEYKEYPNSVRLQNGEMFDYASPIDTPIKMGELMQWYNSEVEKQELHPVVLAALLHYRFVCIHPFDDGNGRLSRLLMNYVLLKNNLPPVIIKTLDKKNYLNALNKADVGEIEAFIKYVAEQLIWSLELVIKATKGESVEELDDVDKRIQLLQRQLKQTESVTEKATAQIICTTIRQTVFPIMILIEEKFAHLNDFFFEKIEHISYQMDGDPAQKTIDLSSEERIFMEKNWLNEKALQENIKVRQFKYSYTLQALKSKVSTPSFYLTLDIWFNDYSYIIRSDIDSRMQLQFPYGKQLEENKLKEIINPLVAAVIEQIDYAIANK